MALPHPPVAPRSAPRVVLLGLVLALSMVHADPLGAQEVPTSLQVQILKKIFEYDDQLSGGSIEVIVAHGGDAEAADDVASAFEGEGFSSEAVVVDALAERVGPGMVVYVMPDAGSVKAITTASSVLSVTGVASLVESGDVSVAVGIEGDRPKIIVNMSALGAEGHRLGADVLKIARRIE